MSLVNEINDPPKWTVLTDLAVDTFGGKVLYATDDFFAEKENLIKSESPIFIADKFTDRGKWMDGWESRRRRNTGNDWAVIRLGRPGSIVGFDVDTTFFRGNVPHEIKIEGIYLDKKFDSEEEELNALKEWEEIIPISRVKPNSHNYFSSKVRKVFTHIRYHMYPDGGTARLRVHGVVNINFDDQTTNEDIDLALNVNGGLAVACSDEHFGKMKNLLYPHKGIHMGDGWETRRRRGPGYDWVVIRLGSPCKISSIVIDTAHFKGNYPDSASVEGILLESDINPVIALGWKELVPKSKLEAHKEHTFTINSSDVVDYIRLNIFPDGGVSRIRVFGRPVKVEGYNRALVPSYLEGLLSE